MGLFSKKEAKKESEFKVEDALNVKGFANFLGKIGESDPHRAQPEKIENLLGQFNKSKEIAKDYKKIAQEQIFKQMKQAPAAGQLDTLDAYFEQLLIDSVGPNGDIPVSALDKFAEKVAEFKKSEEQRNSREAQKGKITTKGETLQKIEDLKKVQELSFWQQYKGNDFTKELEKKYSMSLSDIYNELKNAENMLDVHEAYERFRKTMVEDIEPMRQMVEEVKNKLNTLITERTDPTKAHTPEELRDLHTVLEKIDASQKSGIDFGFDIDNFQSMEQKMIEASVKAGVIDAITKTNPDTVTLKDMKSVINARKSGVPKGSVVEKEALRAILEELKASLTDPKDAGKVVLLNYLIDSNEF